MSDDVRQVVVHPELWGWLESTLSARRIKLVQIPAEDDLPTFITAPMDMP